MDATVTIKLSDLDALRGEIATLNRTIGALSEEIFEERKRDPDNRVDALYIALQLALPVVRFAVANLPPETSPGWPYQSLRSLGTSLQLIPGATQNDVELGLEFLTMSREIAPFEQARARGERHVARTG